MRSRFSAFAKKEADYLIRTLHPDHEDRAIDPALLRRQLKSSASEFRYAGLAILETSPPDEEGIARVLFFARIFQGSSERSFVELSDFARDEIGWRYLRGENLPASVIQGDPMSLRMESFRVQRASRRR